MEFSEKIKRLRKEKGKTQMEVAKALNITKGAYSNYENNHAAPSKDTLNKLSEYFDVSIDYLLSTEKDSPSTEIVTKLLELTKNKKIHWNIVDSIKDENYLLLNQLLNYELQKNPKDPYINYFGYKDITLYFPVDNTFYTKINNSMFFISYLTEGNPALKATEDIRRKTTYVIYYLPNKEVLTENDLILIESDNNNYDVKQLFDILKSNNPNTLILNDILKELNEI